MLVATYKMQKYMDRMNQLGGHPATYYYSLSPSSAF